MTDRRYTDEEMAEIFRRATDSAHRAETHAAAPTGMSLAELQEIGTEAGIPAEQIALAAQSLDQPRAVGPVTRRLIGLPIAVSDDAELDRHLTDAEWEQLVVVARDLFAARGQLRQDGSFRQWTNGNLQVLLEPGSGGHRLRLRTLNGHARRMIIAGLGAIGVAAAVSLTPIISGDPTLLANLDGMGVLALVGAAMLGRGVYGLRRWAERRQEQFRQLIERAKAESWA